MKIRIFSLFLAVLLSAGCGYTTRSLLSGQYKTIYIAQFENKMDFTDAALSGNKYKLYKPGLETDVAKATSSRYMLDGNLKPTQEQSSDLVLRGSLVDFRRDPLRYTDSDDVYEYRLNVVVDLKLYDRHKDEVLWEEKGFTGDYTYFTSGPAAKSESVAINEAVNDLARRIVERTVEQW
ncbi:MAG: LPS assembly lipoprotein LptE [Candidatus Omnitrophica bacterium]|jgi:hypothetical protein|nr:LPS assembly lipoprotein LptE [Candidatus Omnitrophota bacterium]